MDINDYSAVSLISLGIDTVVLTPHYRLDWYLNEYETQPDWRFGGGLGKKKYLKYLEKHLPRENKYFDLHPEQAIQSNQRWQDFCEDCIILVTLTSFLKGTQIFLVHPDFCDSSIAVNAKYNEIKVKPKLIPDVGWMN
jgi:hypothetical protein